MVIPPTVPDSSALILAVRCAYLQLDTADCQRVRELAPLLASEKEAFVDLFYAHLQQFPDTAGLLDDPVLVDRLKGTQGQYLDSLFAAELGPETVPNRRAIGEKHAAVGLEPQWFLGAFNLYIQHCFQQFGALSTEDQRHHMAGLAALMKLILLDIGLALDAYYERSTANLRQVLALYTTSNTELREFARLASHDLKTPLANIANLCEEFLDEFGPGTPAEGRMLIEAAHQRTRKMKGMIDELLSVSEAAAQPGQRMRVSLRTLLDEVLERVRLEVGGQGVTIDVREPLPEVVAHPGRLREALYQLISNAVKFLDKRPGQVRLEAKGTPRECIFTVADNGPGISAADVHRIFAPFQRLQQHRHLPGHGLGLYVVKQIVEEQGGRVWCESRPGLGTQFHIALPS